MQFSMLHIIDSIHCHILPARLHAKASIVLFFRQLYHFVSEGSLHFSSSLPIQLERLQLGSLLQDFIIYIMLYILPSGRVL